MTPRRTTPLGFALDCAGWVGLFGLVLYFWSVTP